MALKLSSSLRKASENNHSVNKGFDLVFTPGKTYNLDDIWANKDRTSTEKELKIHVRYYDEVSKLVVEKMIEDEDKLLLKDLNGYIKEELQSYLANKTSEIFKKYGCQIKNMPINAHAELNRDVNEYIRSKLPDRSAIYTVNFQGDDEVIVNYTFVGDEHLKKRYAHYYKQFAKTFDDKLAVEEGDLLITDVVKKNTTNSLDYKKYLLGEDKSKDYVPETPITTRKPVIVWENGTEDTTTPDQVETVYDVLEDLNNKIEGVLDNAPTEYDSFKEVADQINKNKNDIDKINETISNIDFNIDEKIQAIDDKVKLTASSLSKHIEESKNYMSVNNLTETTNPTEWWNMYEFNEADNSLHADMFSDDDYYIPDGKMMVGESVYNEETHSLKLGG